MKGAFGGILVGIGLLMMGYGLFASGAPPGGTTINLGLLVEKIVITQIGCTLFLAGVLMGLDGWRGTTPPDDNFR